jgi:hypothetical protein
MFCKILLVMCIWLLILFDLEHCRLQEIGFVNLSMKIMLLKTFLSSDSIMDIIRTYDVEEMLLPFIVGYWTINVEAILWDVVTWLMKFICKHICRFCMRHFCFHLLYSSRCKIAKSSRNGIALSLNMLSHFFYDNQSVTQKMVSDRKCWLTE